MYNNIIFFDIDGTLIDEKTHQIPDSTKKALKMLKAKGNLSFINTGRPVSEITKLIRDLNFDGYICGCGTYIEFKDKVLLYKSIGQVLSREIADDIDYYKLDALLEGRYNIYFDKIEHITNEHILRIINQHKYEGFFTGSTYHEDNIDFDKFVVFVNENSNFEGFYNKYKDRFDFINRGNNFYEIVPIGFSKASGIKYLINYLNIDHKNTYAIGDSTNDLSMLQFCSNSIAMGNSTQSLFEHVSYITTNIDDNGIYNALKHFNLI